MLRACLLSHTCSNCTVALLLWHMKTHSFIHCSHLHFLLVVPNTRLASAAYLLPSSGGDEAPPTSLPGPASAPPAAAPAAAGQQQPAALPLPAATAIGASGAAAAAGVGALPLAGVRSEAMGEGSEGGRGDDMEEEEPAAAGDPMADD